MDIRLHPTAKKAVRPLKLLIISSFLLSGKFGYSQQNVDSISLKKEIDSAITAIMKRHGLKNGGFSVNVISFNQQGGQTAYQITNNYYTGPLFIHPTDSDIQACEAIYRKYDSLELSYLSDHPITANYVQELHEALRNKGYTKVSMGEYHLSNRWPYGIWIVPNTCEIKFQLDVKN